MQAWWGMYIADVRLRWKHFFRVAYDNHSTPTRCPMYTNPSTLPPPQPYLAHRDTLCPDEAYEVRYREKNNQHDTFKGT
jgi:hypothetical protein